MKTNIISETPMNLAELKAQLESVKKRDKELNFRAQKTMEYLEQFVKLSAEKAAELKAKIEKLDIPRLKEQQIQKIVDLLPTNVNEVKLILQGYAVSVTNENIKKLADTVKGFVG